MFRGRILKLDLNYSIKILKLIQLYLSSGVVGLSVSFFYYTFWDLCLTCPPQRAALAHGENVQELEAHLEL